MNKSLHLFSAILLSSAFCFPALLAGQTSGNEAQEAELVSDYQEQIKRLVGFLEFSLNTLGDPEISTKEKEVIINESYLKAFQDDQVQIEDDLDENREVVTHKDVQAYLKDVDFFFKSVEFNYDIQEILPQTNDEGMLYFKVTANRQVKGTTVEEENVNNTKVRYIEINLDDDEQLLKIASIYTTKINERQELMAWWNQLPAAWKEILGEDLEISPGIFMKQVDFMNDSTLRVTRDSDTLYLPGYDTIPARGTRAFQFLSGMQDLETLDISGNPYIHGLEPLEQLTGLKTLNFSNTLADNLFPVRNLTHLESLDLSGTPVTDITPLKYNIRIRELYINHTRISSLQALDNLEALATLHFNDILADSLQPLARLSGLRDLRFENSPVSDLGPLSGLVNLEILDLSGTLVTDLAPVQFLTSLRMIYFERTGISDLSSLGRLQNLQVIDLDQTPVSDLAPLKELSSLQKVYCDQSGVNKTAANQFMLSRPGMIVIYESEALNIWWSELPNEWRSVFRSTHELSTPPTIEELHALTLLGSVDVSGRLAILSLEPLSKLTNLKEIRCSETSVTDLAPIRELIDLAYLDCSSTRVMEVSTLQSSVHLKEVNLSSTLVTSLEGLQGATGLEVLRIDNTAVDDLGPIAGNPNLKLIYCDETKIGKMDVDQFLQSHPDCLIIHKTTALRDWWDHLPPSWTEVFRANLSMDETPTREQLHQLTGLTSLDASNHKEINMLEPLNMFFRLETLDLSNAMVGQLDPLASMIHLEVANLSGNPITDLSPLSGLGALTSLDISNTAVERLDAIKSLQTLEYLNCSGTPVKKLDPVETLFQLRRLEINNTNIKSLKPLEGMVALRQLKCFNTSISSRNIEKFKAGNPQVEVVYY